jgi:hypothetical protein
LVRWKRHSPATSNERPGFADTAIAERSRTRKGSARERDGARESIIKGRKVVRKKGKRKEVKRVSEEIKKVTVIVSKPLMGAQPFKVIAWDVPGCSSLHAIATNSAKPLGRHRNSYRR